MEEKKEKKIEKQNCIDCDCKTDDYYRVPTNRGYIYKCVECYELWILRSTRISTNQQIKSNSLAE